jgi:Leucine-rich repeat (LRR) protein
MFPNISHTYYIYIYIYTNISFKYLPEKLGELSSLEYLNVQQNMLVELPPTFHQLKVCVFIVFVILSYFWFVGMS